MPTTPHLMPSRRRATPPEATPATRVLIVEDHKDTRVSLATLLRCERYTVTTVANGLVALEMAKVFPPHVVLLDIGLPDMDGYQVALELRSQHQDGALYIAAVTAYGSPDDKQRAAEAGIDVHVTKPADPRAIVRLIEAFRSSGQGAPRDA
jgi:CheY-like chemotaxis protein